MKNSNYLPGIFEHTHGIFEHTHEHTRGVRGFKNSNKFGNPTPT